METSPMTIKATTWDFSKELDLVNSLWTSRDTVQDPDTTRTAESIRAATADFATDDGGLDPAVTLTDRPLSPKPARQPSFGSSHLLGDLNQVFQFLGAAVHTSSPGGDSLYEHFAAKLDYASDGATYVGIKKALGIGQSCVDETDIDENNFTTDRSISPPPGSTLSKKARWRRNRRMKKGLSGNQQMLVSDSEADSVMKKTPARKASVHVLRNEPMSLVYGKSHLSAPGRNGSHVAEGLSTELLLKGQTPAEKQPNKTPLTPIADEILPQTPIRRQVAPSETRLHHDGEAPDVPAGSQTLPMPLKASLRFTPASLQPARTALKPSEDSPSPSPLQLNLQSTATKTSDGLFVQPKFKSSTRPAYSIEPKILRSGIDRNWALLLKVIEKFPEDRGNLVSPMNMTNHNKHPTGIHVFIDASNIFIGFLDQLKRSRGIPNHYRIPTKVEPSFDAFALLIERRRPVAKRVLVGSKPEVPAFDKAREVGYEVSVLEKVLKARELTERQIFFRDRDAGLIDRHAKPPARGKRLDQQDHTSGSDTPSPQYAPQAYVEQGVDEILHLKILESLVDYANPATIVLATGDAAMAEYSEGFMAMVERALNKGWTVELYSWSQNISNMYKSPKFLRKWEQRFKIIYLDEFAEELLDM